MGRRVNPQPSAAGSAAHLRLNDGNRAFAALLEGLKDEDGRTQKIVSVNPKTR
jgi:hypothetical protein